MTLARRVVVPCIVAKEQLCLERDLSEEKSGSIS